MSLSNTFVLPQFLEDMYVDNFKGHIYGKRILTTPQILISNLNSQRLQVTTIIWTISANFKKNIII